LIEKSAAIKDRWWTKVLNLKIANVDGEPEKNSLLCNPLEVEG